MVAFGVRWRGGQMVTGLFDAADPLRARSVNDDARNSSGRYGWVETSCSFR